MLENATTNYKMCAFVVDCSGPMIKPVLLTKSKDTVQFMSPLTEILHVHLALTGKVDEMRISWVSGSEQKHIVKWWSATEKVKNPPIFLGTNMESHTYAEVCIVRWALMVVSCLTRWKQIELN